MRLLDCTVKLIQSIILFFRLKFFRAGGAQIRQGRLLLDLAAGHDAGEEALELAYWGTRWFSGITRS